MGANQMEHHKDVNIGVLRAAVLGANDGLISTSSLVVGVASSGLDAHSILITSVAALIAGAMSMAAGEYVSVSSQADAENANIKKEIEEHKESPEAELKELADIYKERGLEAPLALEVARQLTAHNALEAHLRDELGITQEQRAMPLQAAMASAFFFSIGALCPILLVLFVKGQALIVSVSILSIFILLITGAIAAKAGGAKMLAGALRVAFWGSAAMGFTALVGSLFGTTVA